MNGEKHFRFDTSADNSKDMINLTAIDEKSTIESNHNTEKEQITKPEEPPKPSIFEKI